MKTEIYKNSKRAFKHEIERARAASEIGNSGMARVCARRAAGIVAGVYLEKRMGLTEKNTNTIKKLKILKERNDFDLETKHLIDNFLLHTDSNHNLPINVNLIDDAIRLASILLGWN